VARRGSTQYGMPAPTLVHFEQQIDAELLQADDGATATAATDCRGVADGQEDGTQLELMATNKARHKAAIEVDWMSLDEMVRNNVHFIIDCQSKTCHSSLGHNFGKRVLTDAQNSFTVRLSNKFTATPLVSHHTLRMSPQYVVKLTC